MEIAAQSRGQERTEDNVGTPRWWLVCAYARVASNNLPEGRQREPQEEDKLEGVVEGEPVDNTDEALDHTIARVSIVAERCD